MKVIRVAVEIEKQERSQVRLNLPNTKEGFLMNKIIAIFGNPAERTSPAVLTWLRESKFVTPVWLAVRVWIGIMWIQAGIAKVWGAENPSFLHNNGAGVAGFAGHGVPAYSWWGSFMHSFVVPNASWIAVMVAWGELAIGIGLAFGILTRISALASLALLFTYVMSGTSSVCAFYALCALIVLATWRTSSWISVDGLYAGYRARRRRSVPVEAAPVEPEVRELVSVG